MGQPVAMQLSTQKAALLQARPGKEWAHTGMLPGYLNMHHCWCSAGGKLFSSEFVGLKGCSGNHIQHVDVFGQRNLPCALKDLSCHNAK